MGLEREEELFTSVSVLLFSALSGLQMSDEMMKIAVAALESFCFVPSQIKNEF